MSARPSEAHHRLLDVVSQAGADPGLVAAAEAAWGAYRELQGEFDRAVQSNVELLLAVDSARIGTWIWRNARPDPELDSQVNVGPLIGRPDWDGRWATFVDCVAEEDREAVRFAFDHGLEDELEFQVVDPSGQRRWLMARGRPLPGEAGPVFMAGTLEDVTVRRAMQEQLRDADAKYRAVVEQLPAIVYIVKLDRHGQGRTTYISSQVERVLGYTVAEWLADPHLWWKIVDPAHRARVREEVRVKDEDLESRQRLSQEYPVLAKDGRRVWLRNESMTEWSRDGRTRYTDGVLVDVTVTRAREERLRLLQHAFEAMPLGITVSSPDGRILFVNAAEAEVHGYRDPADIEGQPVELLGDAPHPPPNAVPSLLELPRRHRDGSVFRARVWTRAVQDEAGGVLAVVTVTEPGGGPSSPNR